MDSDKYRFFEVNIFSGPDVIACVDMVEATTFGEACDKMYNKHSWKISDITGFSLKSMHEFKKDPIQLSQKHA